MANEREAWLAKTQERPLEPELPICDPHHHFWDRPNYRYTLDELLQDTGGGHNIAQTVFVECSSMYRQRGPEAMQPVGETEFVQGIAAQSASGGYGATVVANGIVGFADLRLGAGVEPVLEAHLAASGNRFRGIRHASAWDPSPDLASYKNPSQGMLSSPEFREGFARLEKYGLSYDAWLYHPQLDELADLARSFPDVTIILDHIGGPVGIGPYADRRAEVFDDWKRSIEDLAQNQNVVVKLGGLGMPLCGFGWRERAEPPGSAELAEAMSPFFNWCMEKFGPDRCMFESNFPVDKVSYSYTVMWNAFKIVSKDFSSAERSDLFHDTAARAYRLDVDG